MITEPDAAAAIDFTMRLTAIDSAKAVRDASRQDLWWAGGATVAVLAGLYAIGLAYGGNPAGGLVLGVITAALVAVWLTSARWIAYVAQRRHPQAYNRVMRVRLDADGLYSEWGASRGTRAWSDMDGFIESPEYLVLRWGRLVVAFFPKAQLPPATVQAVRTILQAHLGAPKSAGGTPRGHR